MEDQLLPPNRAALLLGCDPATLRRWSNEGKLTPVTTPGGHRRYQLSELRKFIGLPPPEPKTDF